MEDSSVKRCTRCDVVKPKTAEHFTVSRYTPAGLPVYVGMCKPCRALDMAAKRAANPERHRAYAQRSEANRKPENDKARWKRRYWRHRDSLRAKHAEWRKANPEKEREYGRSKYYRDLPATRARYRRYNHERRARLYAAEGKYTAAEWEAKLTSYGRRCHWCAQVITGTPHADHLIPLARGGSNSIGNIVPSCAGCNRSKNAKMPWEFAGRLM